MSMIRRDIDDQITDIHDVPEVPIRTAQQKRYGVAPPVLPGIETPADQAKAALRLGRAKLAEKRSLLGGLDTYSTRPAKLPAAVAEQLGKIPAPIGRKA
jgi:hypothetical protein